MFTQTILVAQELADQKREYLQKLQNYKSNIKKELEWSKNISPKLFKSRWAKIASLILLAIVLYELVQLLRPAKKSTKVSLSRVLLEFVLKEMASLLVEMAKKKLRELIKK